MGRSDSRRALAFTRLYVSPQEPATWATTTHRRQRSIRVPSGKMLPATHL